MWKSWAHIWKINKKHQLKRFKSSLIHIIRAELIEEAELAKFFLSLSERFCQIGQGSVWPEAHLNENKEKMHHRNDFYCYQHYSITYSCPMPGLINHFRYQSVHFTFTSIIHFFTFWHSLVSWLHPLNTAISTL